jgi:DNA replication protein DnaC
MKALKLNGMCRAFEETLAVGIDANFTSDELLAHLIDAEYDERHDKKITRLLNQARLREQCTFADLKFSASRNLDKNTLLRLTSSDWLTKAENVIVTGATGVGKSFIACALGHAACVNHFRVCYLNAMKMFTHFKFTKADGTYEKEMKKLQKQSLLIIDDFGLEALDAQSRLTLLEILEDRIGKTSTLIASQLPPSSWHKIIGEPTIADAICDRLIHTSHKIELKGDSMRKKVRKRKSNMD